MQGGTMAGQEDPDAAALRADVRVARHAAAFNAAVRSGDWGAFADRFTPDATMHFTGVPAGPFTGRDQIARGYAQQPPTEALTVTEVRASGAVDTVRLAWASGDTGTMELARRGRLVSRLAVIVDR
jgi:steroid Delta-isomerase